MSQEKMNQPTAQTEMWQRMRPPLCASKELPSGYDSSLHLTPHARFYHRLSTVHAALIAPPLPAVGSAAYTPASLLSGVPGPCSFTMIIGPRAPEFTAFLAPRPFQSETPPNGRIHRGGISPSWNLLDRTVAPILTLASRPSTFT